MNFFYEDSVNYFLQCKEARGSIIFVPGTGCSPVFYHPFLKRLHERNFNIIGYDYPGHGPRREKRGHFRVEDILQEIKKLCEKVYQSSGSPVYLMGSSMGGIICFFLSFFEGIPVKRIICHNALVIPWVIENLFLPFKLISRTLLRILSFLAFIFPHLYISTGSYVRWRYVFDEKDNLRRFTSHPYFVKKYTFSSIISLFKYKPPDNTVHVPVLVISGDREKVVPVRFLKMSLKGVKGDVRVKLIEGAGHMLPLEYTEKFLEEVLKWL